MLILCLIATTHLLFTRSLFWLNPKNRYNHIRQVYLRRRYPTLQPSKCFCLAVDLASETDAIEFKKDFCDRANAAQAALCLPFTSFSPDQPKVGQLIYDLWQLAKCPQRRLARALGVSLSPLERLEKYASLGN